MIKKGTIESPIGVLDCEYEEDEVGNITTLSYFLNNDEMICSVFSYDEWYRLNGHCQVAKNDKKQELLECWQYNDEDLTIAYHSKISGQEMPVLKIPYETLAEYRKSIDSIKDLAGSLKLVARM